ncbi:hypothetical protein ACKWTF_014793 [Chironomus riparius]
MDNIVSFVPYLWKVFQYDVIQDDRKSLKNAKNLKDKITSVSKSMVFGFYVVNLIGYFLVLVCNIYDEALDVSKLSFFVTIFSILLIVMAKCFLIFKNREKIQKIMQKLPACYSTQDEQDYKVTQQLRWSRFPFLMNLATTFLGIFISFLTPFDENIYFNSLRFPFMSNAVVYYFANLWIRMMIIVSELLTIVNENIIYGLLIVLTVEFKKLNQKVEEIKSKITENSRKISKLRNILPGSESLSEAITSKITETISNHNQLLDIRDSLEEIFAPAFLINFLCGLVCLCTSEILFLVINDPIHGAAFLSSGISQALIFFVQCNYCQQLKDASLNICDAIYDCKWEDIEDVKVKKHLLMILMRSQKSKTLTCWKFAENSFELFGSFMSSNYSFFTIFRRFYYKS